MRPEQLCVRPGRVSQIERGELSTIEAIARYVQGPGGRLDFVANFTDHPSQPAELVAAVPSSIPAVTGTDAVRRSSALASFSAGERQQTCDAAPWPTRR